MLERDPELRVFRDELVGCLVRYGGLTEPAARSRVDDSRMCEVACEIDRALLLHETPYYWAMSLLYARTNPRWFDDRALWPPPDEYDEWSAQFRAGRDPRNESDPPP